MGANQLYILTYLLQNKNQGGFSLQLTPHSFHINLKTINLPTTTTIINVILEWAFAYFSLEKLKSETSYSFFGQNLHTKTNKTLNFDQNWQIFGRNQILRCFKNAI